MRKIFCLLLMAPLFVYAQVNQQKQKAMPLKFETIVQTGLLVGDNAESATLQAIAGMRHKKWYAGVGTGLDFYLQRSVPLFADVRYDFSAKRKTFFLYGDAGVNFAWTKNKEQQNIIDQTPGLFTDAGIGLKIATKKQDAFLISVGYSHKQLEETQKGFSWWSIIGPGVDYASELKYNYSFNRIAIKFGFVF
ncbi:hypothetical protein ESA94_04860 [Lacibacter luteus]|uniref:Outer membrane protein beta-barrel domain-containing protein n=1 Tax=Lacibacter luteus TaxID=2508719 RepID=A0A4Q1CMS6_9BACT|nr:hypothetical protein [Lacibacter luteus]RXK62346.1 hypothetical protein ESA94_04860 [Lacibacter luteus]